MSDLTTFRDHARKMATARHKGACPSQHPAPVTWTRYKATVTITPCLGCMTDAERAQWARLADEVDAYLGSDDQPLDFGEGGG